MDHVNAARALMGDSLGFHIIFALLGVGLPLVFSLAEFWGIRRKNNLLIGLARRVSYFAALLATAGVVSGTIIAFQMLLMWPGLIKFGGPVVGLAFSLEGYAFLLEAIFLAFYLLTWNKIKGYKHWLISLPVILGSALSAFFITSVNSWMNHPTGFDLVNGQVANARPWRVIFGATNAFMSSHTILGYYLTTLFFITGIAALYLYRRRNLVAPVNKAELRFLMHRFSIICFVLIIAIALIGHFQSQYLHTSQPRKFAALELVPKTQSNVPYVIAGDLSPDGKTVQGGFKIPSLLSILTGNRIGTTIRGLNDYPKKDWPLLIINKLFEVKLLLVGFLTIMPLAYLFLRWKHPLSTRKPFLVILLAATGPVSLIVIELGWMVTELGRQPFVVEGYLRTADAFSKNPGVTRWGFVFPILYLLLFIAVIISGNDLRNRLIKQQKQ